MHTDFREMIAKEKLDGAIVCLGSKNHPRVAPEVLRMGVPIFLEKAMAIDLEGTNSILESARETGLVVQVDHQKRYNLAYRRAYEIVRNTEKFGHIIQIESKMHGFPVFPTFFTCMLEWQSHNLDLVQFFGGSIRELYAWSHRLDDRHGALTIMLRFENEVLGTLGWGTYGGPGQFVEQIEIISDQGKGVIVRNARQVTFYQDPETGETWEPDWNPISPNQSHVFNGYVGGLRHFIDCVRDGKKPSPSIEEEAKTMEWLFEIARKAGIPTDWEFISSAL
ncbi:MAG: Gfo/Idh/MocA family oxidoreductase [Candidatus Atribacteria bacterium]|nr:Gfo/Idh/MocA family oxidoreductase [Candidatus Atribacteria bacterium]